MNKILTNKSVKKEDFCYICKRKFPLKFLLTDTRGMICVDCVVTVEIDTLKSEIEASKVLDD